MKLQAVASSWTWHLALAVLVSACGGASERRGAASVSGAPGTGGRDQGSLPSGQGGLTGPEQGAGAAASVGSGGLANGDPPVLCPSEPPSGSCQVERQNCTYGDARRRDCRTRIYCESGRWQDLSEVCPEAPAAGCPVNPTSGDPCNEGVCEYEDGTICECFEKGPGRPAVLSCAKATGAPECPAMLPNIGTKCAVEALECTYGDPCLPSGARAFCRSGVWVGGFADCSL